MKYKTKSLFDPRLQEVGNWTVAYRRIDEKQYSLLAVATGTDWNADPFLFEHRGTHYLFVESFDPVAHKGVVSVSVYENGSFGEPRVIVEGVSHLAFPRIFEFESGLYLYMEEPNLFGIPVYEAVDFPYIWKFRTRIASVKKWHDPLIFEDNNSWFLLATPVSNAINTLNLLSSTNPLSSSWIESERNPIKISNHSARNGGMLQDNSRLIRVAQEKSWGIYGRKLHLYEISRPVELNSYRETRIKKPTTFSFPITAVQEHTITVTNSLIAFDFKDGKSSIDKVTFPRLRG